MYFSLRFTSSVVVAYGKIQFARDFAWEYIHQQLRWRAVQTLIRFGKFYICNEKKICCFEFRVLCE